VASDQFAPDEQALPSSRTNGAIRAYFDAREAGDADSAWGAVKDAALSWRADNTAGGVPVFGHLPLPKAFAADLARDFGQQESDAGPKLRELLVQLEPGLANQVKMQLESAKTFGRQARLESDGAFHLLGGDDGDRGGAPLPSPRQRPRQSPSPSPSPRPKPVDPAEEEARKAKCAQLRHHYVLQRRAINEADAVKTRAERRVWSLRKQRDVWLNEIKEIEAELSDVHARSTDPRAQIILECPAGHGPKKPPRGRRERRAERQRMIQEGLCNQVGAIDSELAEDRWRERLELEKKREIRELEAELRVAKQKLQEIDPQIEQAQNEATKADADVRFYQGGLGGIFREYEASCGDPRELFPIPI
jgi:hypothetical protein